MRDASGTLLCVANFQPNTGYAWDFIDSLYAGIADHMALHGVRTIVAYPAIRTPPINLEKSAARAVALDVRLDTLESIRAMNDLIRRENVLVVYFTDRAAQHWAFLRFRRAGVRRIIVHDHTSGERTRPWGLKRIAKRILMRIPGITADVVVAVSEYVARRQVEVGMIPRARVKTVYNGLAIPIIHDMDGCRTREIFGLEADRLVVVCSCRATAEKGVHYLIRAFDRAANNLRTSGVNPALVYVGDGPQLAALRLLREGLTAKDQIIFAGYRKYAKEIVKGADLCVVPSVWQEAFGLAVLEAMVSGKAVIGTRVGGIPEIIEHGVTGWLVPPGNEEALAQAIHTLLMDPARRARIGKAARERAAERFSAEQQLYRLAALVEEGFGQVCQAVRCDCV